MSKITLTTLTDLQNELTAVSAINSNSNAIVTAMDNTLSRDGTAPNQMQSNLDMNSNRVLNLPAPLGSSEPARLADLHTLNGGGTVQAMPAGGTTGQVLTKSSNTDYAVNWQGVSLAGTLAAGSNITLSGSSPTTVATTATPTFTTVNGNTITTGTGTLTIGAGKTLTANNSLTLTGTDGTSFAHPSTSDTLAGIAATQTLTNKTINGANNTLSVRLANDVTGNLPVNNLNSGASASNTTFWRGDGTWSAVTVGTVGLPITPQGRLTLSTGNPTMVANTILGGTSMYYTPYNGNIIPIYNGSSWTASTFSEISTTLSDTTKNPSAIGASKVNDWFVWNDAGTIRLCHGPDWTNDTTRSAGTALARINGILTNNVAITNGPAQNQGTYVGTSRSNASSTMDFIFGAAASGGTAAFLSVWNMYNRINFGTTVTDTGTSYTYTSATIRQARASTGNQISFVLGLAEDAVQAQSFSEVTVGAVSTSFATSGLGFDTTTAYSLGRVIAFNTAAVALVATVNQSGIWFPPIGLHTISLNEASDGTHSATFNPSSLNGLQAIVRL